MDPLKHLQVSRWPHLETICCHGNRGNALPITCFSDEGSSNIQIADITHCSLDAEAVQSLVMACPDLYYLTVRSCNLQPETLTCLSQAGFLSLRTLDLSRNPLGWSGVQSLSSCHLPAMVYLRLDDTNMSALAAMHLAQGCWPKLHQLHLFDNQLDVEAVAHLVKGEWPQLQELSLTWTCVSEDAFEVLDVDDACKQFEDNTSHHRLWSMPCSLLRSSFLVWPELKALTVRDAKRY